MRPEITGELEQLIEDAVESGPYRTKGEFVRDACRHHLDRIDADNYRSLESLFPPADPTIPIVRERPGSEIDVYDHNGDHVVERERARERVEE